MTEIDSSPERMLKLAALHRKRRLGALEWRDADLPVPVQIAWLSVEILADPAVLRLRSLPTDELLFQAVREVRLVDAVDPDRLVAELAGSDVPFLESAALRLIEEGLKNALLAPASARRHLVRLLETGERVPALRELAKPWAALDPLPPWRLAPFLSTEAALVAAARHGHGAALWTVLGDEAYPPELRQHALRLLGELADRHEVGALLAVAEDDPLLFGEPAIDCLRTMHRRGHFPADRDAAAVLRLALSNHSISPVAIATVLYTARHETVRLLTEAPADDRSWPRRLDLLVALAAPVTAIGDAITSVLAETSAPRPFLKAIRALRHGPAEDAVLAVLPAAPAAALATLEAIGGPKAVSVLKEGLCGGQIAPHLRAVRHQALELLWHLTDDRQALLARLNPHDLPARIAADLGGPDERELALLAAHLDPDEPVAALVRLAANGGSVPVLTDLLSRIVADLAASAWDPAAAPDPVVPPEVLGALRDVGRRLYERKRIRPAALLDAETPDEAGDAFVASIALDLLDRPELSDGERAILLELLGRVPYARTTARVHPLLRHRDRQVRKHAIALIAGDPALSASVTLLTGADDVQTVRQALLALGKVRAVWACPAITACLDHPNMNIKKTAATVLAEAGTATAVPKLLFWLGSHDNTGFRTALVEALRAILGDAFAATVLSAAENAADDRARELLLRGLGRTLSAQVVQALIDQGSAAARVLAKLISNEPQATRTAEPWSVQFAMRVLDQPGDLTELRPMLSDWLRLAEARPDRRADILRLVTRFCPAPWSAAELEAVTSWKQVLVAGFDDVPELTGMLEAVAPALSAEQGLSVAATIRAKGRSALRLLRLSGAVLVRADLDQALACARLGPNPWLAEQAALRESFGVEPRTGAEPWAESLRTAARAPDLLRKFREQDDGTIGSRPRLDAMIEAFPAAGPEVRELLLDWMTALQPLGAPPWTLSEARREHEPAARPPRSAALRDRLLTKLADPDQTDRDQAARALQSWPEPEFQQLVLRAYLAGDVQIRITRAPLELDGARPDRVLDLIAHLDPDDRVALLPHVLTWWAQGSASARAALRYFPADVLAQSLQAGAWDLDDLLAKRPLLRTPELAETDRRLRAEGRDGLILVNGPLRDPDHDDHQTLARLLTRPEPLATPAGPSRAELFAIARDGEPEQIRRALSELAEHGPDPDLEALLGDLITHRSPRVRLHAHRISRRLLDQPAYLQQTMRLLADPLPDVVRSAIKTLAHARWKPAIPLLVELLDHSREPIRRAAADGLALIGRPAIPALTHTAGRARPDRRHLYDTVLARIII